ncbi:50S ribosomal protein L5 [Candidatus Falkowbacteria bacterium]|jgi:large subunit ribosomal protein L5|nr:50S ribosomal protein L5 [Candidatus Falkowbacteria bacterium]MBT7007146.1 50S ribosomal protein L5 [Candidatus Falkowbacteria bacterium]MBT7402605.1 50S ribosomal protein L5 [Candidatus Woesearchaeota archaeon]
MNNLYKQYNELVVPKLMEEFGCKNRFQVPQLKKIVINVGVGSRLKDKEYLKTVKNTLERITGQKPVETVARKSISNFKIRDGMVVGVKVTLRGTKMWDFIEKLVKVTLPRVRDFRGVSRDSFDNSGNYSLGFNEHVAFPEIQQDEVESVHGLEVNLTIDSNNKEESFRALELIGFPFKKNIKENK